MTVIIQGDQLAKIRFGSQFVTKNYPVIAVETKALYTVTGIVALTALFATVDTAITVAGTTKLQHNPTTGVTGDLCAATDIGTTDTPAGNLLSMQGLKADSLLFGVGAVPNLKQEVLLTAGSIEMVTATGADGGVTWYLSYVPVTAGASVVAA